MKKKLLATIAAVCLSLTACNSTEQTKDVQANEKKDNNTEQQTAKTSPKAKEIKEKSAVERLSQDHSVSLEGDGANSSDFF